MKRTEHQNAKPKGCQIRAKMDLREKHGWSKKCSNCQTTRGTQKYV